jgi:hypothetical protein
MTVVAEMFYPRVETGDVFYPVRIIADNVELLCAS